MKSYFIAMFLVALWLNNCTCSRADDTPRTWPEGVSLIQLIASPGRYDGHLVRVEGYVRIEFEGNAIYLHEDDARYGIYSNALWLDLPASFATGKTGFFTDKTGKVYALNRMVDENYATLVGVFRSRNHGHRGLFCGSIGQITRLDVLPEAGDWKRRGTRARRK